MEKSNKKVLITIIILLVIFAPLTVVGLLSRNNISLIEENPKHEAFFEGYLWFYDSSDKFLSKYECSSEICGLTNTTIDDEVYNINYYKDGKVDTISVINDKYAFITDGALIHLYSVDTGKVLQSYKEIKNYKTTIENNAFIIKNTNDVWGVIKFDGIMGSVLPFEYSFIGLINKFNENGSLNTDKFIVQKDSKWYIADNTNSIITGAIDDPIIDYNDNYIFSKENDKYRIYSYENYEYLSNYEIKDYVLLNDYIAIVTDRFVMVYNNLGVNPLKTVTLTDENGKVEIEKIENKINIKINGTIKDSIELS